MSFFATAFSDLLNSIPRTTLSELGSLADMAASELSTFRAGHRSPSLKAMTKLLPAIEQRAGRHACTPLLMAYLRDETPEAYTDLITLYPNEASIRETPTDTDPRQTRAQRWAERAAKDQDFDAMWHLLDTYMFPR